MSILAVYVDKPTTIIGNYKLEAVWVPKMQKHAIAGPNPDPGVYLIADPGNFVKENPEVSVELMTKGGGLPDPPGTLTAVYGQPLDAIKQQLHALLAGQGGDEVAVYKKPKQP